MKFEVVDTTDNSRLSHAPLSGGMNSTTLFDSREQAEQWMTQKRLSGPRYAVKEAQGA